MAGEKESALLKNINRVATSCDSRQPCGWHRPKLTHRFVGDQPVRLFGEERKPQDPSGSTGSERVLGR